MGKTAIPLQKVSKPAIICQKINEITRTMSTNVRLIQYCNRDVTKIPYKNWPNTAIS